MLQTHEIGLENVNASIMFELSNSIANFAQKFAPSSLPFRGTRNHSWGRFNRE